MIKNRQTDRKNDKQKNRQKKMKDIQTDRFCLKQVK